MPTTPTKTPARTRLAALALAATPAATPTALAQYEITIDVENPVLMPGESTTVTLRAGFDPIKWAMARVETDFVTSVGSQGWSDPRLVEPMHRPATSVGMSSATGYDGIIAGQLNFFDVIYADPTNPIAFWKVTYTAPLDAAAPIDINLSTMTSAYEVYFDRGASSSESHLADLTEGSATIHVIPAPASASLLALGLFAMRRRRGQASSSSGA